MITDGRRALGEVCVAKVIASAGRRIFWTLAYYIPDLVAGAEDASVEANTCRVITVQFAEDC